MGSIASPGIGSGLDVTSLVNALVASEISAKQNSLNRTESSVKADISAIGQLQSALSTFQSAVNAINEADDFSLRAATVSDETYFTATTTNDAVAGSYDITIDNLATKQTVATQQGDYSASTDVVSADGGTITITMGTDDGASFTADGAKTPVVINIAAGATLADVRDAINADADSEITATIITSGSDAYLTFTSNETGKDNAFTLDISDNDGNNTDTSGLSNLTYVPYGGTENIDRTVQAIDAQFDINGLNNLTSGSNTLDDVIDGVTINLLTTGNATLTISDDNDALTEKIQAFVDSYNDLMSTIDDLSGYDPDTGKADPLQGDSIVRSLQSQLRALMGGSITSTSSFDNLIDLGITTGSDGELEIDSTDLADALSLSFDDVSLLFTESGALAETLDDLIENFSGSEGILTLREDQLNDRLDDIEKDREKLEIREELITKRYLKQFTALDALIAQMQGTSSYLTQQLGNLPKIGGNN